MGYFIQMFEEYQDERTKEIRIFRHAGELRAAERRAWNHASDDENLL
jgi:hypothetical protein